MRIDTVSEVKISGCLFICAHTKQIGMSLKREDSDRKVIRKNVPAVLIRQFLGRGLWYLFSTTNLSCVKSDILLIKLKIRLQCNSLEI